MSRRRAPELAAQFALDAGAQPDRAPCESASFATAARRPSSPADSFPALTAARQTLRAVSRGGGSWLDHFGVGGSASTDRFHFAGRERTKASSKQEERMMRLNSEMVDRTLSQIDAQAISEDHPLMPKLKNLFGDHTFFVDESGLNIIEPQAESPSTGTVVNVASWDETKERNLVAHEPQTTDVTVELEKTH
jgi:hypothetical protein